MWKILKTFVTITSKNSPQDFFNCAVGFQNALLHCCHKKPQSHSCNCATGALVYSYKCKGKTSEEEISTVEHGLLTKVRMTTWNDDVRNPLLFLVAGWTWSSGWKEAFLPLFPCSGSWGSPLLGRYVHHSFLNRVLENTLLFHICIFRGKK